MSSTIIYMKENSLKITFKTDNFWESNKIPSFKDCV